MEEYNKFEEFLLKYKAALKTLETQINILLQDYEYKNNSNPVEHIKSRIKTYESASKKLTSRGYVVNAKNLEEHVHDIIGIRIVCGFLSDIYKVVEMIEKSDQITIHKRKDYIKNPKDSGYSSYHLLVYVPVFLLDGVTLVEAEIQIRTLAMDFWASLDHKIAYKFKGKIKEEIREDLYRCAKAINALDHKMLVINEHMNTIKEEN